MILLTDGQLSHMYETVDLDEIKFEIKERKLEKLGEGKRHFTGLTSKGNLPNTRDSENYRKWYEERKKNILDKVKEYNFYEYNENKESK